MVDNDGPTNRPLRADARRNRELVLSTAREMMAVGGLSVSFDEIARRAGVGVGTVYRHFPTRDALFEAVILGRIKQFVKRAEDLAEGTEPSDAFLGYFEHLVDQMSLDQALCEALEASNGTGFTAPENTQRAFHRAMNTLLRRAQKTGTVRSDLGVADVLDVVIGCATAERRARRRKTPDRLLAVVLDGLRAGSGR